MTTITTDILRDMVGKRITIGGERHRIAKVVMKARKVTTEDGVTVDADDIYRRGPGFFVDAPKKSKKTTGKKAKATEETAPSKRGRTRRKPKAEADEKPTRRRKKKVVAEEAEKPTRRTRKTKAEKPTKKKPLAEFTQKIAEQISNQCMDMLTNQLAATGTYDIIPVAVGASYSEEALKVVITMMPASLSAKQIKAYIQDHRESTDVASDEEEDDDLELANDDDDDLELDEEAETDLELDDDDLQMRSALSALTTKKLRKIAAHIEVEDYADMDKDDLVNELCDYADEDLLEAAKSNGIFLIVEDSESDDDLEEEVDTELDDDLDEVDEVEDEEELSEDDANALTVQSILERAPKLNEDKVLNFVTGYMESALIDDAFGDEMMPGETVLQEKGKDFLLVGFDLEEETVKLLNLETLKFRSKSISEVARMEVEGEE